MGLPSGDVSQRPTRPRSATPPRARGRSGDAARLAAYTVLRSVAAGGYANLELPKELRRRHLRGRDAAFATELTYGACRLCGFYDPVIALAADRPLERLDEAVLDTLRLGAHQLLGMRVPAHAAADETVALARQVNGAGAAGLVNAVMRRISEADRETWLARVVPTEPLTARLAVEQSHPEWIVKALRQALIGHGASTAGTVDEDLERLLAADNAAPELHLVARPGLIEVEELVRAVESTAATAAAHPHVPTAVVLDHGDPGAIAAIRDGRAAVQDAGSQVVAAALVATPRTGPGHAPGGRERWLDLCAGPGGKAGLLAALAVRHDADLVANEVAPHRATLVEQTLAAAIEAARGSASRIEVRTGDGRRIGAEEPAAYDRILVDAPCTGLGALRRRPEARWRRTTADLAALGTLQRELLGGALPALAPGGILAYATCSPHLAETTFVIADVLKKHPNVQQIDARAAVADVTTGWTEDLGPGPGVQLWPHIHGTDGMFFALLRREG
ncbi:RsmB/NOP family class I SAM-dependent RNA methyltransferase [Nostocoides jenkinsii]|uniref:RsmB/NOP family class I SAM-dependent RNA methyltransferase n=1 Tax=Nostocoides jenkinsii TaxID=330834 RepID=UPI00065BF3B4